MRLINLKISGVHHDFGTGIQQIRIAERDVFIATMRGTMLNIQNFGVLFDREHNVLNEQDEVLVSYCESGHAPIIKKVTIMYFMSCFGFEHQLRSHLEKPKQSRQLNEKLTRK